MTTTNTIYNNLLEDPDLEIGENQTREEAAQIEADQRTRQYMNNVQALSLANEPLNKAFPHILFAGLLLKALDDDGRKLVIRDIVEHLGDVIRAKPDVADKRKIQSRLAKIVRQAVKAGADQKDITYAKNESLKRFPDVTEFEGGELTNKKIKDILNEYGIDFGKGGSFKLPAKRKKKPREIRYHPTDKKAINNLKEYARHKARANARKKMSQSDIDKGVSPKVAQEDIDSIIEHETNIEEYMQEVYGEDWRNQVAEDRKSNNPKGIHKVVDRFNKYPKEAEKAHYEKLIKPVIDAPKIEAENKIKEEEEAAKLKAVEEKERVKQAKVEEKADLKTQKDTENEELKQKKEEANELPHSLGHLDEYLDEDEKVSSVQATKHARELMAHAKKHEEHMTPKTKKEFEKAMGEAVKHGADVKRLQQEMEEFGDNFGSDEHLEAVHDEDKKLASQQAHYDRLLGGETIHEHDSISHAIDESHAGRAKKGHHSHTPLTEQQKSLQADVRKSKKDLQDKRKVSLQATKDAEEAQKVVDDLETTKYDTQTGKELSQEEQDKIDESKIEAISNLETARNAEMEAAKSYKDAQGTHKSNTDQLNDHDFSDDHKADLMSDHELEEEGQEQEGDPFPGPDVARYLSSGEEPPEGARVYTTAKGANWIYLADEQMSDTDHMFGSGEALGLKNPDGSPMDGTFHYSKGGSFTQVTPKGQKATDGPMNNEQLMGAHFGNIFDDHLGEDGEHSKSETGISFVNAADLNDPLSRKMNATAKERAQKKMDEYDKKSWAGKFKSNFMEGYKKGKQKQIDEAKKEHADNPRIQDYLRQKEQNPKLSVEQYIARNPRKEFDASQASKKKGQIPKKLDPTRFRRGYDSDLDLFVDFIKDADTHERLKHQTKKDKLLRAFDKHKEDSPIQKLSLFLSKQDDDYADMREYFSTVPDFLDEKEPLPGTRETREYISINKPAPVGVRIYNSGEYKGGQEGTQFYLVDDPALKIESLEKFNLARWKENVPAEDGIIETGGEKAASPQEMALLKDEIFLGVEGLQPLLQKRVAELLSEKKPLLVRRGFLNEEAGEASGGIGGVYYTSGEKKDRVSVGREDNMIDFATIHELGHQITAPEGRLEEWIGIDNATAFRSKMQKLWLEASFNYKAVTAYARENKDEFIAENFRYMSKRPKMMKEKFPEIYEIMTKYLLNSDVLNKRKATEEKSSTRIEAVREWTKKNKDWTEEELMTEFSDLTEDELDPIVREERRRRKKEKERQRKEKEKIKRAEESKQEIKQKKQRQVHANQFREAFIKKYGVAPRDKSYEPNKLNTPEGLPLDEAYAADYGKINPETGRMELDDKAVWTVKPAVSRSDWEAALKKIKDEDMINEGGFEHIKSEDLDNLSYEEVAYGYSAMYEDFKDKHGTTNLDLVDEETRNKFNKHVEVYNTFWDEDGNKGEGWWGEW